MDVSILEQQRNGTGESLTDALLEANQQPD